MPSMWPLGDRFQLDLGGAHIFFSRKDGAVEEGGKAGSQEGQDLTAIYVTTSPGSSKISIQSLVFGVYF